MAIQVIGTPFGMLALARSSCLIPRGRSSANRRISRSRRARTGSRA
jgi:hypothetical protein